MSCDSTVRLTERRNPRSIAIDERSTRDILDVFHAEDRAAVEAVAKVRDSVEAVIDAVVAALSRGGRLFYVGAGTSGRLGVLDASECPPTFGSPPGQVVGIIAGGDAALRRSVEAAEDDPTHGARAIRERDVGCDDFVVGIAASGRTPYVLGAVEEAHKQGARTALLSVTPPSDDVGAFVDVFITPIVGPEIIAGSTRLKAGTATKLILNQMTTAVMIRLGKVHDNLMVDVQATNAKLRDRARWIVMEVAGVEADAADTALARADGRAKVACLMLMRGLSAEEAHRLLDPVGRSLRAALRD